MVKKSEELNCFKSYDIRGEIGLNLTEEIVRRIGRATAQHLKARSVIIGFDARETSPLYAEALARGVMESGSDVLLLGMCGTEEVYWAVTQFQSCAGIMVTASHNPINFNGLKIVKRNSSPLDKEKDFEVIKRLAENKNWVAAKKIGIEKNISEIARKEYTEKVLSFVDISKIGKLKILVNSGNGAAGPSFDSIRRKLSQRNVPIEFVLIDHEPNYGFPNGIPNPLLPENQIRTSTKVKNCNVDMGIAFDGDFDRCFFFDEKGSFVSGEYIVGILAEYFLQKERGATIVHDTRSIWNTIDAIEKNGGIAVESRTGHAFVKKIMRKSRAIYGGELSAHHYFRDFAYCDSGMIPWLIISEIISKKNIKLSELIRERIRLFPSSGEKNYEVNDSSKAFQNVVREFEDCQKKDFKDGLSCSFDDWRFNLRKSNTEPLIRLNVEAKKSIDKVIEKTREISKIIMSSQ